MSTQAIGQCYLHYDHALPRRPAGASTATRTAQPHLERMAQEGLTFDWAYCPTLLGPSRCAC